MSCREIVFARGTCLVEIRPGAGTLPVDRYQARLWLLGSDGATIRPLVRRDGTRLEVHGPSPALAMSRATVVLERHFGALSEPEHASQIASAVIGAPHVVED